MTEHILRSRYTMDVVTLVDGKHLHKNQDESYKTQLNNSVYRYPQKESIKTQLNKMYIDIPKRNLHT